MATTNKSKNRFSVFLIIVGMIGLLASLLLTIDKMAILKNPNYVPPCNVSPFISCSSVMKTAQAHVFGFDNSLLGIAFFAAVMAIGFAQLAGGQFKRWFWLSFQAAATFSLVWVYWFAYQALFKIGSLCPYCMVVWSVTIPLAVYIKLHNLREGYLPVPRSLQGTKNWAQQYHWLWLVVLYGVIIVAVLWRFWPYWVSLIAH